MTVPENGPSTTLRGPGGTAASPVVCSEDLRLLSKDELMDLYRKGSAPSSVRAVEGHPAGLGLASIMLSGGRIDRWVRRYSRSQRFPWHGKSFVAISDSLGWGWNRLAVGPVLDAFPFRTYIAPSRTDGALTLVLNFDVPRNPRWGRLIWDELREVIPGVFLGPTGLRLFGGYRQLAWFAVDTTRQTPLPSLTGGRPGPNPPSANPNGAHPEPPTSSSQATAGPYPGRRRGRRRRPGT